MSSRLPLIFMFTFYKFLFNSKNRSDPRTLRIPVRKTSFKGTKKIMHLLKLQLLENLRKYIYIYLNCIHKVDTVKGKVRFAGTSTGM